MPPLVANRGVVFQIHLSLSEERWHILGFRTFRNGIKQRPRFGMKEKRGLEGEGEAEKQWLFFVVFLVWFALSSSMISQVVGKWVRSSGD